MSVTRPGARRRRRRRPARRSRPRCPRPRGPPRAPSSALTPSRTITLSSARNTVIARRAVHPSSIQPIRPQSPQGEGVPGPRGCCHPARRRADALARHRTVGRSVVAMRIESSVTSVSWIPSEAITGMPKSVFEVGLHALRRPARPTCSASLEQWRAENRFRFANRLSAWIEVEGDRIVDAGYSGGGMIGVTTVKLASKTATVETFPLPDIQEPPEITAHLGPLRADGGRAHRPAGAPAGEPPAVRAVHAADRVDEPLAHDPRRRHRRFRRRRREHVPPPLGLRRRRQARGQGRAHRLQGVVAPLVRQAHAVGRRDVERPTSPRWRPRWSASSRRRSCAAAPSPTSAR